MFICVCACGGQRSTSGVFLNPQSFFTLFFETGPLTETGPLLLNSTAWPARPVGPPGFLLPSTGITGVCCCAQPFLGPMLIWRALYCPSHLTSPNRNFLILRSVKCSQVFGFGISAAFEMLFNCDSCPTILFVSVLAQLDCTTESWHQWVQYSAFSLPHRLQ